MSLVRVVVADDSQIAAERIAQVLSRHVRIRVVASKGSAEQLAQAVEELAPDVVTLDLLMPDRTGLALIRGLSARTGVVVVSDHDRGSTLAQESLAQGALAYIEKRTLASEAGQAQLLEAVLRTRSALGRRPVKQLVAIAGSTGAIAAFEAFAADLRRLDAAIAVVQHLPADRTASFASWLCTLGLRAEVVSQGGPLASGHTYVAPGNRHLILERGARTVLDEGPPIKGHRPSATALFRSLVDRAPATVAVVLSGMGDDGAATLAALVQKGARCIVQKRSTCPATGMPDAAMLAAGGRALTLAPREIGLALCRMLGQVDGG